MDDTQARYRAALRRKAPTRLREQAAVDRPDRPAADDASGPQAVGNRERHYDYLGAVRARVSSLGRTLYVIFILGHFR